MPAEAPIIQRKRIAQLRGRDGAVQQQLSVITAVVPAEVLKRPNGKRLVLGVPVDLVSLQVDSTVTGAAKNVFKTDQGTASWTCNINDSVCHCK